MTILVWNLLENTIYCNTEYTSDKLSSIEDKFTIDAAEYFSNIHPDDIARIEDAFATLIRGEVNVIDEEYRIKIPLNGDRYKWCTGYATVGKRDENGIPISIVGAIKNIDEHKKMEVDLYRAKE